MDNRFIDEMLELFKKYSGEGAPSQRELRESAIEFVSELKRDMQQVLDAFAETIDPSGKSPADVIRELLGAISKVQVKLAHVQTTSLEALKVDDLLRKAQVELDRRDNEDNQTVDKLVEDFLRKAKK